MGIYIPSIVNSLKSNKQVLYIALASTFQLLAAAVVTITIPADPKNAFLWGFSVSRLILVAVSIILAGIALTTGICAYKRQVTADSLTAYLKKKQVLLPFYFLLGFACLWGWLSIFLPSYWFGSRIYLFERLQPISIALGLSAVELSILLIASQRKTRFQALLSSSVQKFGLGILLSGLLIAGTALFITVTKIGLVGDTAYWNVAGMPLSDLQLFGIFLFTALFAVILVPKSGANEQLFPLTLVNFVLPVLIFLAAFLVWGQTPMLKHTFSMQPTYPQYQPYPISDARVHDLGGIAAAQGKGIYFHYYTDKPVYMLFLSSLHLVAGYDYITISWLQILFLASVPVVLYLFGKKFHSPAFGLFLAFAIILRQRNAIALSHKVFSVNPKLLVSEMLTLLGLVLFAYLVFRWYQSKKLSAALLCGGVIGAVSLVRMNPLVLIPGIIGFSMLVYWGSIRNILKHTAVFAVGALILIVPWLVGGVSPDGTPWMLLKFIDVINVRYNRTISPQPPFYSQILEPVSTGRQSNPISLNQSTSSRRGYLKPLINEESNQLEMFDSRFQANILKIRLGIFDASDNVSIIINHFFHNLSTSVLSLPDSLVYDDLNHLTTREYWQEYNKWNGNLPPIQSLLVVRNLVLLAVGIGYSWKRYRWNGLIPLFIFICYSASLAFAMNSGGRYIVPVDWCVYFYFLLAVILLAKYIFRAVGIESNLFMRVEPQPASFQTSDSRAFSITAVGLLLFTIIIPITNNLIPALIPDTNSSVEVEAPKCGIDLTSGNQNTILYGEILYPYHAEDNYIYFTVLSGSTIRDFAVENIGYAFESGDMVIVEGVPADGSKIVQAVYNVHDCTQP